jgi:hypothetical protein
VSTGTLVNSAVPSRDTYEPDLDKTSQDKILQSCSCEIELFLDGRVDLLAVISACYAISKDDTTREYTFFLHNCWFFSWAVFMVVSRHCLPYEIPQLGTITDRFINSHIERLTSSVVDEVINLFLDLVTDTITIFREKAGTSLQAGMSMVERAAWHMPISQYWWRKLLATRISMGLRSQIEVGVRRQLQDRMTPVYQAIIATHATSNSIDSNLWIDEVKDTVEPPLRAEVAKVLWDGILDAFSLGFGNVEPEKIAEQLNGSRLRFWLLGRNTAQFCAVWDAALRGSIPAAKEVAHGHQGKLSDEVIFDKTWFAIRDAALASAQAAVKSTSAQMNNPQRDLMWDSIWGIWNESWGAVHEVVRPKCIKALKTHVEELVTTGTRIMIDEIKERNSRGIQARIPKVGVSAAS